MMVLQTETCSASFEQQQKLKKKNVVSDGKFYVLNAYTTVELLLETVFSARSV
jgi:hypothetical protein